MNLFGIDILQLIIYVCVGASLVVVVYILKLTRTRNKTKTLPKPSEETPEPTIETKDETIKQLVTLVDKIWSHSEGLSPNPNSCPTPKPEPTPTKRQKQKKPEPKPEPTQPDSILTVNEETYKPTEEDKVKELLERIGKRLGEK